MNNITDPEVGCLILVCLNLSPSIVRRIDSWQIRGTCVIPGLNWIENKLVA